MSIGRSFKILFSLWMALWVLFFLRENKKGGYTEAMDLFGKNLEAKRAYLLGEGFYGFLEFCRHNIPDGSRYKFEGLDDFSIKEVRGIYYLCPLKAVEDDYDYIFVYGSDDVVEKGYEKYLEMNKKAYILKRK